MYNLHAYCIFYSYNYYLNINFISPTHTYTHTYTRTYIHTYIHALYEYIYIFNNPYSINIAPEQGSGSRLYDDKADMYSVGIVLFEMASKPFTTGMERAMALRKVREGSGTWTLPHTASTEQLSKIITMLTSFDPTHRPSASDLLLSPLLPPRLTTDGDYLKELTEAITRSHTGVTSELLSTLFASSREKSSRSSAGMSFSGSTTSVEDGDEEQMYVTEVVGHCRSLLTPKVMGSLRGGGAVVVAGGGGVAGTGWGGEGGGGGHGGKTKKRPSGTATAAAAAVGGGGSEEGILFPFVSLPLQVRQRVVEVFKGW